MALTNEDLEQVGSYVQKHLIEWLPSNVFDIVERLARIEERIDNQQQLMKQGFEEQRADMNARFEQVDKRFEQVDKRFQDIHKHTNRWMTALLVVIGLISVAVTAASMVG